MGQNPYAEAGTPFYGRTRELEELTRDLGRGASTLGTVMGGRGMGKTSFARKLEERLLLDPGCEVHRWPHTPSQRDELLLKLSQCLSFEFTGMLLHEEVRDAVRGRSARRTVIILDEIDDLIGCDFGRFFLENIRIAWEELRGSLGVVILGGSSLYELLESNVSPFLRNAEFVSLRGLSRDETAQLIREPCGFDVEDDVVELLWQETAGHPAVVTEVMRAFVDKGDDLQAGILSAIDPRLVEQLETRFFSIWWKNLRPRGQDVYRRLVEYGKPVARDSVARLVGGGAGQWLQVLETTGVLRVDGGEVLPRGELFGRWARREHFQVVEQVPVFPEVMRGAGQLIGTFEERLVVAVAHWANGVVEHAALGLMHKPSDGLRGNDRLLPEAHFQVFLLLALQQNGWTVHAESWSGMGRADLEVSSGVPGERAHLEIKIWGRAKHLEVVEQVRGYSNPSDDVACVVMLDRFARSLVDEYRTKVIETKGYRVLAQTQQQAMMPQFLTEHPRPGANPLRVYHFLLQLPSD